MLLTDNICFLSCSELCWGNLFQTCGGFLANSVYKIEKAFYIHESERNTTESTTSTSETTSSSSSTSTSTTTTTLAIETTTSTTDEPTTKTDEAITTTNEPDVTSAPLATTRFSCDPSNPGTFFYSNSWFKKIIEFFRINVPMPGMQRPSLQRKFGGETDLRIVSRW
eukprot:m.233316 g.233316  ORF g.233316 m.233316 type:complete len:167 (+) comp16024_c0_seq1:407-907(+)